MKFTLNDYQSDAVGNVLAQLERARKLYHHPTEPRESSVALTAPTGAGKTVMAAAVIEALFFGSDRFDFAPDPTAVVIWFSDSPSLNDQSRQRLMQASEKLDHYRLVTVRPPFATPRLDPGHVYFMNTQLFSKSSKLTRGYVESTTDSELDGVGRPASPDQLAWNIWQTVANTIDDETRTLYFVLDEAHRGFDQKKSTERQSIVRRLVSGEQTGVEMPIVLGISATPGRFTQAMKEADARGDRLQLPEVTVDVARVQASGLLKDAILLDIPDEPGDFSTTLVTEAAKRLRQSEVRWKKYARAESLAEPVVPLLVFQVQDTPDPDAIGRALDAIHAELPELRSSSFRHVLGEKGPERFGSWTVEHIDPQRVQETTDVRVLLAKTAISTGWDCPRAEVLVSFRPANDQTHIAQLIGRMVRSPLARRVPGNDRLNSVDCILPYFDRTTAGYVVKYMTGQIDGLPATGVGRVFHNGVELEPNPFVADDVWSAFDALPTLTAPQRGVRPVKRLVALAQALSEDGLRPGAIAEAQRSVHAMLDAFALLHPSEVTVAVREIHAVHLQTLRGVAGESGIEYKTRVVAADDRAIRTGVEDAKRVFGSDVVMSYVDHLCPPDGGEDDDLRDAFVRVAALATVKQIRERVDAETDKLTNAWFVEHRVAIRSLSDERQSEYETIRSLATDPQLTSLIRPKVRIEDFAVEVDGVISTAPLAKLHLMSNASGDYPTGSLNNWEREIVDLELKRPDAVGWYRNPAHNGTDSLAVPYSDEQGNWRSMHPDFVFFNRVDGRVVASIVDPHGHHLTDSLVKLQGLARFADRFGDVFHRIEAVVKHGKNWRVLDLQRSDVRELVLTSSGEVESLYKSDLASVYA